MKTTLILVLAVVLLTVGTVQYLAAKRERDAAAAFPPQGQLIDVNGVTVHAEQMGSGPDVVLLHGCCHNPTGANLTGPQWQEVIAVLQDTGATPMIDIAYQGFGDGVEADAAGTRAVADAVPECLIAASCSKNFGIYRERTGVLMLVASGGDKAVRQGTLAFLNRQNYSFPPDHGARLVTMILEDEGLRTDWLAELEEMRVGMLSLREQLAKELECRAGSNRIGFIAVLGALAWNGYALEALFLWWLPYHLAITYIVFFLSWAPHHPGGEQGRYRNTRSWKAKLGNLGSMGMQFHIVHHLHPYIPLHLTPAAYWEMRPILEARGARLGL